MVWWRSQRFREDLHSVQRRLFKGCLVRSEVFRHEEYINNGSFVSILKLSTALEVKKVSKWIVQKYKISITIIKGLKINAESCSQATKR